MPFLRKDEASAIYGKPVGEAWYDRFLQHHPEIIAAKAAKLDLKCANNFNAAVISDYFDKLEALNACFPGGIPPEHVWNMDEKGIQMGGGRKNTNKKFLYLKGQNQKYCLKSNNLELVTVIECVSAAGDIVPPSFCLRNGSVPDLQGLNDDQWGR